MKAPTTWETFRKSNGTLDLLAAYKHFYNDSPSAIAYLRTVESLSPPTDPGVASLAISTARAFQAIQSVEGLMGL